MYLHRIFLFKFGKMLACNCAFKSLSSSTLRMSFVVGLSYTHNGSRNVCVFVDQHSLGWQGHKSTHRPMIRPVWGGLGAKSMLLSTAVKYSKTQCPSCCPPHKDRLCSVYLLPYYWHTQNLPLYMSNWISWFMFFVSFHIISLGNASHPPAAIDFIVSQVLSALILLNEITNS